MDIMESEDMEHNKITKTRIYKNKVFGHGIAATKNPGWWLFKGFTK